MPTLTENLDALRGTTTGPLVEPKSPAVQPNIVRDLVEQLDAQSSGSSPMAASLIAQSFDVAAMKEHKTPRASHPDWSSWVVRVRTTSRRWPPGRTGSILRMLSRALGTSPR